MAITASVSQKKYNEKCLAISEAIRSQGNNSEPITLLKDTSNLFRHRKQHQNKIDVRHFNQVLEVDQDRLIATVEGMTTFEDLVEATLAVNCMPLVVPELKTITVGGALSGIGIESSSFRYGLVHEAIVEFDVLLPTGEVVSCRKDNEHSDLFHAFANSYGTLGYALRVKIKLINVSPFVALTHHHFEAATPFLETLHQLCKEHRAQGPIAFIEAVVFHKAHYVITTGTFLQHAESPSNYKFMKIYYKSVEEKQNDVLTIKDYLWRWDTDWFWCSQAFKLQTPILRFLLGKWALKSRVYSKLMRAFNKNKLLHWALNKSTRPTESVIQDVAIPFNKAGDFLNFFMHTLPIRPFWICPIHPTADAPNYKLFPMDPTQLYLNFGFWDTVPSTHPNGYYNRLVENKVVELQGNKSLYSNVFYSEDEFWGIYDKAFYQSLKSKYDPNNVLNDLFTKCTEKSSKPSDPPES